VVFKWLMRGFSGHLPPDQLLVLWDLVNPLLFKLLIKSPYFIFIVFADTWLR